MKYCILNALMEYYESRKPSDRGNENPARSRPHISLESILSGECGPEKSEYLADTREENSPVLAAIDANLREIIDEALGKLKPIERDVVVRHY